MYELLSLTTTRLTLLSDFDWSQLPQDSVVVDVGGGIGSLAKELTRNYPHLRIIVQDLPKVIEDAEKARSPNSSVLREI